MYASKVECWRQNTPSFTLEALGRETAALSFVTSLRIAKPRHMPLFDFLRRGQSTQDAPQHLLRPTYLLKLIAVFFLYLIAGKLGLSMPFTSGNVSPVWPASGIALSAVLLWGWCLARHCCGRLLGEFLDSGSRAGSARDCAGKYLQRPGGRVFATATRGFAVSAFAGYAIWRTSFFSVLW